MRTFLLISAIAIAGGCAERPGDEARPAAGDDAARRPAPAAAAKPAKAEAHGPSGPAPLEALTRLSAGNARFIAGQRSRSAQSTDDAGERAATSTGQQPFAAILSCADSRVPPELLFDQSIGDLFVVRNAGNVAEPVGGGSLEYAVEHLGVRLIVVLGHASCGAVKAVTGSDGQLPGQLAAVQRAMPGLREYAGERARAGAAPAEIIAAAVERNAAAQAAAVLAASPPLRDAVAAGRLAVVPAVYDLACGSVGFLPPATPATRAAATAAAH